MKNIVILVSLSILFFGCTKDWGTPATKNYPINGAYTKLDVSNAFEVTVSDQVTEVVVTVGEASRDFNGVISMNPSGAFLWQSILEGADSREKLVRAMLERYEDLDEATARADLDEFLQTVAFALEE